MDDDITLLGCDKTRNNKLQVSGFPYASLERQIPDHIMKENNLKMSTSTSLTQIGLHNKEKVCRAGKYELQKMIQF